MTSGLFTQHSAKVALARIRPDVERIQRLYAAAESCRGRSRPDSPVDPTYFALVKRICQEESRLRSQGIRLLDPRLGRVGFPSRHKERPVLLCWDCGELEIRSWCDAREPERGRHRRGRFAAE